MTGAAVVLLLAGSLLADSAGRYVLAGLLLVAAVAVVWEQTRVRT